MLATFDVPFDVEAATVAVDAAVETGQPLVVVNVAETPILPVSMSLGYEYLETPELTSALRVPADLAASLGLGVELLRVSSPRPVDALLQLVAERSPGLLVVGPERAALPRRKYRKYTKAARRIREHVTCLLWLRD
jgi:nucleotide-binding universal stress UspA family protein